MKNAITEGFFFFFFFFFSSFVFPFLFLAAAFIRVVLAPLAYMSVGDGFRILRTKYFVEYEP